MPYHSDPDTLGDIVKRHHASEPPTYHVYIGLNDCQYVLRYIDAFASRPQNPLPAAVLLQRGPLTARPHPREETFDASLSDTCCQPASHRSYGQNFICSRVALSERPCKQDDVTPSDPLQAVWCHGSYGLAQTIVGGWCQASSSHRVGVVTGFMTESIKKCLGTQAITLSPTSPSTCRVPPS